MLSQKENELLTRVGPGTVMGDLMRQYWLPCLYSWEVEPGSAVLREGVDWRTALGDWHLARASEICAAQAIAQRP